MYLVDTSFQTCQKDTFFKENLQQTTLLTVINSTIVGIYALFPC